MTDMISSTLRDRADGDIHIELLLAAVHTGVRRRRRRGLAAAACAVVTAAALTAAGGVTFFRTHEAPPGVAESADIPRPPLVEDAPVATFTPTVIGSDPTLFHLDVTGLDDWANLAWSSRTGLEDLRGFSADAGGEFLVEVAQERDRLSGQAGEIGYATVNGLAAEAVRVTTQAPGVPNSPNGRSALRWEAVPGVWVQVVVPAGLDVAMRIAERVRLDRTFRCAVPFRLTGLDTKVRVVKCDTWFFGATALGGVYLNNGPQNYENYTEYYVAVGKPDTAPVPNETIGGRAVTSEAPAGSSPRILYPYDGGVGYFYSFFTTLDDPFLRSLVPAFQPVKDTDPRGWPRSPLG
jgi:hypothetical protein